MAMTPGPSTPGPAGPVEWIAITFAGGALDQPGVTQAGLLTGGEFAQQKSRLLGS
ncbi:hypothetical protein [Pseudonocardia humida]|uniref:Uncharacterized protein n=1 Tax=Pseudonocardia humida TaxID=2800819 RepID=A0ABT1AA49_9PSEU|nr:hypothetical protein [Pseudonocardia humida]MCO1659887.1 hypothetical protein [Pseudonocardia humida]